MIDRSALMSRRELRNRGWTDGLISRFLGEADATRQNPRYRSKPPMRLWLKERAEAEEASPTFAEAKRKADMRSGPASAAAKARRDAEAMRIAEERSAAAAQDRARFPELVGRIKVRAPRANEQVSGRALVSNYTNVGQLSERLETEEACAELQGIALARLARLAPERANDCWKAGADMTGWSSTYVTDEQGRLVRRWSPPIGPS